MSDADAVGDALDQHGTVYIPVTGTRFNPQTVHVDRDCAILRGEGYAITERGAVPLGASLCRQCNPDVNIDRDNGNGQELLDALEGAWADD